jgi:hypothetical protein
MDAGGDGGRGIVTVLIVALMITGTIVLGVLLGVPRPLVSFAQGALLGGIVVYRHPHIAPRLTRRAALTLAPIVLGLAFLAGWWVEEFINALW